MPKTCLPHDVTSEDRAQGCLWASRFRRASDEVEKLGTIGGTPTINRGVTLNGTTDYITYGLWGQFGLADPWSCHCLFWPDFNYDSDNNYFVFDTNAPQYAFWKRNNASNNVLRIDLGGTTIVDVAEATYSALWVAGGRNLITISSTTGATDAWLNGTQIVTADPSAWTAGIPTTLAVGATTTGANFFDGMIESLHIYGTYLQTAGEHAAIWAGGGA